MESTATGPIRSPLRLQAGAIVMHLDGCTPVSYTHLDVYKRQAIDMISHCLQRNDLGEIGDVRPRANGYRIQFFYEGSLISNRRSIAPVSYTHLDVYKRQV